MMGPNIRFNVVRKNIPKLSLLPLLIRSTDVMRTLACHDYVTVSFIPKHSRVFRPFEKVFQSISGRLPERKKGKKIWYTREKISKEPPPAPIESTVGPEQH